MIRWTDVFFSFSRPILIALQRCFATRAWTIQNRNWIKNLWMSNNVSHWKRIKLNVWITLYVPAKKFINNIFFAERAIYPSSKRQQMNNDRVRAKERQTEREKQHLIYLISFNIHKYNRILCHLCAHVHTSRSWSAQNITNLIIHSCAYNKGRSAECWLNGEKKAKKCMCCIWMGNTSTTNKRIFNEIFDSNASFENYSWRVVRSKRQYFPFVLFTWTAPLFNI